MKTKKEYTFWIGILFIITILSPFTLHAQYDNKEIGVLVDFLNQEASSSQYTYNYEVAGITDPPEVGTVNQWIDKLDNYPIKIIIKEGFITHLFMDNTSIAGEIHIDSFTKLQQLYFGGTSLSKITITNCGNIEPYGIDISNNQLLKEVFIDNCNTLEIIEILANVDYDIVHKNLQKVTISNCSSVRAINFSRNRYGTQDLDDNPELTSLIINNCPALQELDCSWSPKLQDISITGNHQLEFLYASRTGITDFSQFNNIKEFISNDHPITQLPGFSSELATYSCANTGLSGTLDLSQYTNLQSLTCYGNNLEKIVVANPLHANQAVVSLNQLRFSDIKEIFDEGIRSSKAAIPQKIRGIDKGITYVEQIEIDGVIDLSSEYTSFDQVDDDSEKTEFTWYKVNDKINQIFEHDIEATGTDYSLFIQDLPPIQDFEEDPDIPGKFTIKGMNDGDYLLAMVTVTFWEDEGGVVNRRSPVLKSYSIFCLYKVTATATASPSLQFKLKQGSETDYANVASNQTTTADEGTNVNLGIVPVTDIIHDKWQITYTDNRLQDIISEPRAKDAIYEFPKNPHPTAGTYPYKITKLELLDDSDQVIPNGTFNITDIEYTIVIKKKDPPGPEPGKTPPTLQYQVKVNDGSYKNEPTGGRTVEKEKNNVYIQILPDATTGNIDYDNWQITYTPPNGNSNSTQWIKKENSFEFNPTAPHSTIGTYPYNVTILNLYKDGKLVAGSPFTKDDPYTIQITKDGNPGGIPGQPIKGIELTESVTVCANDLVVVLPFKRLYTKTPMKYAILFSEEAKKAGFSNISEYVPLPEEDHLIISIPEKVPKGTYKGTVHLESNGVPELIQEYHFEIFVLAGTQIIKQPISSINLCIGDLYKLEVEAVGEDLSYQWFRNGDPVQNMNNTSYELLYRIESETEYYVLVSGLCGDVKSETVTIKGGSLQIHKKWNDFLYVMNTDNRYSSFQWYKDGVPISTYGNSVYYTDADGLLGSYTVRAFYNDGRYEESCPMVFSEKTKSQSIEMYPNPVEKGASLYIDIHSEDKTSQNIIEIFDISGRRLYHKKTLEEHIEIPINMTSGYYAVKIVVSSMPTTTKILIVK